MKNPVKNKTIEIDGALLKPGFSVYLIEVIAQGGPYYYAGMTGDSHYTSARSGIDRLGKHFETIKSSTQNRIYRALGERKLVAKKIKMHHWSVPGFDLNYLETSRLPKGKNNSYKIIQREVLALEQEIISAIKQKVNDRCLNSSLKKKLKPNPLNKAFVKQVLKLVR